MLSQEIKNCSSLSLVFPANNSYQTVNQSRAIIISQPWFGEWQLSISVVGCFCFVDIRTSCLLLLLVLVVFVILMIKNLTQMTVIL